MDKPKNARELKQLILAKEIEQANDKNMIKQEYDHTLNSLKPANLLQYVLTKTMINKGIKIEVATSVVALVTGFIEKKIQQKKNKKTEAELLNTLFEISNSKNTNDKTPEEKTLELGVLKKMLHQYIISSQKND